MPIERAHRWLRPPHNLLVVLALITAGSATAPCWLGWTILRQDEVAANERVRERLEFAADRAVQSFDRLLGEADRHLTRLSGDVDAGQSPPTTGMFVVATATEFQWSAASRRLFYPFVRTRPEPSPALFAEGEAAE